MNFARGPLSFLDLIMIVVKCHGIFHVPSAGLDTPKIFTKFEVSYEK